MTIRRDASFAVGFAPYLVLQTTLGAGDLDVLRSGHPPRYIEVEGGVLRGVLEDGTTVTTRTYASWDKCFAPFKTILASGTTATGIQVYW